VVDALGLPLAYRLTGGNRHEFIVAYELVEETKPKCLLADKAYSSKAMRQELARLGCEAVIPCSSVWKDPPPYDREKYKWRKEVECTFNLLKQARRVATRYEKTLRNYASVIAIGCALLWLRI
jgi:transposase